MRTGWAAALLIVAMGGGPEAQGAVRLRWQTGQVFSYRVEQKTQAAEVVSGNTAETRTQLNVTKRWTVAAVDAEGVATLHLALAALRVETTTAGGDTLLFDSNNSDKSTPQLRDQMGRYIGQTLAVLRVDGQGRVLEVKESKFGPPTRYESEPPFVGVLPAEGPTVGQTWDRTYAITLAPPQGTGEKFPAVQRYTCKNVENGAATVAVTTEVKNLPAAAADQVPLLQSLPEGSLIFDVSNGRLLSAALKIEKELKNHQGEGSSYRFTSTYTETLVNEPK